MDCAVLALDLAENDLLEQTIVLNYRLRDSVLELDVNVALLVEDQRSSMGLRDGFYSWSISLNIECIASTVFARTRVRDGSRRQIKRRGAFLTFLRQLSLINELAKFAFLLAEDAMPAGERVHAGAILRFPDGTAGISARRIGPASKEGGSYRLQAFLEGVGNRELQRVSDHLQQVFPVVVDLPEQVGIR